MDSAMKKNHPTTPEFGSGQTVKKEEEETVRTYIGYILI